MDHSPFKSSTSSTRGGKKNFLVKTWERCRSVQGSLKEKSTSLSKSKSWHDGHVLPRDQKKAATPDDRKRAPGGCFSVYVGPEKQRFAVKAKYANHPLFMMLLEDAEMEYGYNSDGPITLPCEVDLFYKVLAEMGNGTAGTYKDQEGGSNHHHGSGFASGSCSPFNPSRRLWGHSEQMAKGYGSYGHITPSRLIKMN